jgi:cytochrome c
MPRVILVCSTICVLSLSPALHAAEKAVAPATEKGAQNDAKRARALLDKAVDYYKGNKDRALAAFSRVGEFTSDDLYVYVIGINGQMLASGGSSSALIGRDVSGMRDAAGKLFFREMIDTAQSKGSGTVEYRWLNQVDRKVESKVTYYTKVDDRIIAVGFYIPRATPEQAKAMLEQAVKAVESDPRTAFASFNDLHGTFVQDDLYVFVVDLKEYKFRAHGANPRLVYTDALELKDPTGDPIIKKMIAIAKTKGQGSLEYKWRNPVTEKVETKHTLLRKVNDYLVGVGYYTR